MFLCSWSYLGLYHKSLSTPIPWYVLEYQVEWPTIVIPLVRSFRVPPIIVIVVTFTCSVLFLEHGGYTLILWFVLVWVLKYSRSTKPSSSWCYYITSPFFKRFALKSSKRDVYVGVKPRLVGRTLVWWKAIGIIVMELFFVPWYNGLRIYHKFHEEKHQMCWFIFFVFEYFSPYSNLPLLEMRNPETKPRCHIWHRTLLRAR